MFVVFAGAVALFVGKRRRVGKLKWDIPARVRVFNGHRAAFNKAAGRDENTPITLQDVLRARKTPKVRAALVDNESAFRGIHEISQLHGEHRFWNWLTLRWGGLEE